MYRSMEQNREPRNNRHLDGPLIFDNSGKNIQRGKESVFIKLYWENWTDRYKKMKLDHFLTPHTKNSKRIKD